MTRTDLIDKILNLKTRADAIYESQIPEPYKPRRNNASMVGDLCLRFLVMNCLHGNRKKVDPGLQRIFNRGTCLEQHLISEMRYSGIQIEGIQFPFDFPDLNLGGKGDCQAMIDGVLIPLEVKIISYSDRISSVDDFIFADGGKRHFQHYPVQLNIAMRALEAPAGAFVIGDPVTFNWKILPMEFNWGMWEKTITTCRAIEQHLAQKTLPPTLEYREDICGSCIFLDLCFDNTLTDQHQVLNDPELEAAIDRREQLKELVKENTRIDKLIKDRLPSREGSTFIGRWEIIAKECYRKSYQVAESFYLRREFRRL